MAKRNPFITCGIAVLCGGCVVGSLVVGFIGRSIGTRSSHAGSTSERARALGMHPTIEEATVNVPADADAGLVIDKAIKRLNESNIRRHNRNGLMWRDVLVGFADFSDPNLGIVGPARFRYIQTAVSDAVRLGKRSQRPAKIVKNGIEYERQSDQELMQVACALTVVTARQGDFREAEAQIDRISRLNDLLHNAGTTTSLMNHQFSDISILRAAERCAQLAPDRDTALRICTQAIKNVQGSLNLQKLLSTQGACDAMVIDTESNKVFREIPMGFSVRDAFRESAVSLWVKHFPNLPTKLDDLNAVNKELEAMRKDAREDFMLKNAGLSVNFINPNLALMLARVRLMEAEIQALNGQRVTAVDPFSQKPVKAVERNGSVLLYSYGPDHRDDHGRAQGRTTWRAKGYDLLLFLPPFIRRSQIHLAE